MSQIIRKLFLIFVCLSGLLFVACTGGTGLQPLTQGSTIPPLFNPSATVTDSCSTPFIVSLIPSTSSATTNEAVEWTISATGCTGSYEASYTVNGVTSIKRFTGTTPLYTKSYSAVNSYSESVVVRSLNSSNGEMDRKTASGSVSIVAPTTALLRCNIINPSGSYGIPSVSVNGNAQGEFVEAPDFQILVDAPVPAKVVSISTPPPGILYYSPDIAVLSNIVPGSPVPVRLTLGTVGYSYVTVRVANAANLSQTEECTGLFEVKTIVAPSAPPPSSPTVFPPSADLLAAGNQTSSGSPLLVASGGSVSLSWTSVLADSCTLSDGGAPVAVPTGASTFVILNVTAAKTFTLSCQNSGPIVAGVNPAVDRVYVGISTPTSHLMFVSSATYNGALGGLVGADQKCNAMASAAASTLGAYASRPWKAMIAGEGQLAPSRLQKFGPVYNNRQSGRQQVASSIDAMFNGGLLTNPIVYSETGSAVSSTSDSDDEDTWTGVKEENDNEFMTGAPSNRTCANWTSSSSAQMGHVGSGGQGDDPDMRGEWLADDSDTTCNRTRHIYCISQ